MKTSTLLFTALTTLVASVQGCPGSLRGLSIQLPKYTADFKTPDSMGIYMQWTRPYGVHMGKFGPISCTIAPGSDTYFVYGSLNTTGYARELRAKPMMHFGDFVYWAKNATREAVDDMGWHVSRFEANIETGKVKVLRLDVLTEGEVISKEYTENSINYTASEFSAGGITATIKG